MTTRRYFSALFIIAMLFTTPFMVAAQPEMTAATVIQEEEILVQPREDWLSVFTVPEGDGVPVLYLQSRLNVPGASGGCNWMLRVFLNDMVLYESMGRPRLLNKPPFFEFGGGEYRFTWFNTTHDAWMTMFSNSYAVNTAGTGQDTEYLIDISGYVNAGESVRLRIQYAQPNIPSILGYDAPLAVRQVRAGLMPPETVAQMREELLGHDIGFIPVPIAAGPADEQSGEPPYEIAWVGREEDPPAQVFIDDAANWQAEFIGEAEVTVATTKAFRIWQPQTAKIDISEGKNVMLRLKSQRDIELPADTNAVNVWLHGNHDYGRTGSPLAITVTVRDATGATVDFPCGVVAGDYWELRQGIARDEIMSRLQKPLFFESITFTLSQTKKPMTFYLESLAFFNRVRDPYIGSKPVAEIEGLVSADNILPPPPADCAVAVAPHANGRGAVFTSNSPSGTVQFTVDAGGNGLDEVTARLDDGTVFHPLSQAALQVITPLRIDYLDAQKTTLVDTRIEGERFISRRGFSMDDIDGEYELIYELRGRTLVIDVSFPGGRAIGLDLGYVTGLDDLRSFEVPYLLYFRAPGPRVALGEGVFTSVLLDWAHSNASFIESSDVQAEPGEKGLRINQGSRYDLLTNGTYNDFRERILVTVSPEFHDTLPSIANERSPRIEELAPTMFVMSSDFMPGYFTTLKRYGMDHIIAMHFAGIWWERAGEGFSMRWRPRPQLSEQQVADYRRFIRALGYPWGMLVNYNCFFPINEYWDENKVSLMPGGTFRDSWYGHFETKPSALADLARIVGEEIAKRYPTENVYLDVHTNFGASARDFEAEVPLAGMARGSILYNIECIEEVRRQHHSVCSEGIYRWMYAGPADMDYAQWVGVEKPEHKPLLPDFDLLRIHPKQIGTAMGYGPTNFFTDEGLSAYYADPQKGTDHLPFYHYVAATLAHGHSALIGYGYFPHLTRTIHYYALLSGPQTDYLPDTVTDIAWYDEAGAAFIGTSEALGKNINEAGKLRVTYFGGQTIYINYHPENQWALQVGGRDYLLPPYGWVIVKPGEIHAYSALVDGRRVDYVECPEYIYLNSGNGPATEGAVTVDGAVFIRKTPVLSIIPCGDLGPWSLNPLEEMPFFRDRTVERIPDNRGVAELAVDVAALLHREADIEVTVAARNAAGEVVTTERLPAQLVISPSEGIVDYVVTAE